MEPCACLRPQRCHAAAPLLACRRIKEQVFGATTFWVTETRPLAMQSLELGVTIKGNL